MVCSFSFVSLLIESEMYTYLILLQGLESMYSLAQKCMQLKPVSSRHKLMELLDGILGENTEVRNIV